MDLGKESWRAVAYRKNPARAPSANMTLKKAANILNIDSLVNPFFELIT